MKKRSMSYDINGNKLTCCCCGKKDISVLPATDLDFTQKSYVCTKCSTALQKKQDYASTHNGTAKISSKGQNLVEFTCTKGHTWTVNLHRPYKNWCSTCIKLNREENKRKYRKQSNRMNKEKADRQKKLFNEEMSQYLSDSQSDTSSYSGNFEDLFSSILPLAKAKADAYMNQPPASSPCTYEQALAVYKVLELDASRVQFILSGMSADSKKVGFKKLALSLHPDKNRHPLSKEAFQKASELFK